MIKMKKIYWIPACVVLVLLLGITTCLLVSKSDDNTPKKGTVIARISDADVQTQVPHLATQQGVFRNNMSSASVEGLMYDACRRANWKIVNKGQNSLAINYDRKGYNFDATIRYTSSKYSIVFKRLNQDRGNRAKAHEVYKKNAEKLNAVIQKLIYKGRY